MPGWISLHRSLLDHKLWKAEPFTKGQAWVDILLLTNYSDQIMTIKNGTMIEVKRGQCGYSELALGDRWKWSRGKVGRFLKLLESQKMIQQKKVENRTIIVICNYEEFQTDSKQDSKRTLNGTVNGHLTDTNNKENKETREQTELFPEVPKKKKTTRKATEIEYPDWLDRESFDGFIEFRKEIKRPASPRAIKGLITALDEACNGNHYLQKQIIEKSIVNGWRSLFKLKDGEAIPDTTQEEGYMSPQQIHDNIKWDVLAKLKKGGV